MGARKSVSIRQLHARTGAEVRRAGRARTPTPVTDRGDVVAILSPPNLLPPRRRGRRVLLPEYADFLRRSASGDVLDDLDAVRGDR